MKKTERKKALKEWNQIIKYHPTFAQTFLAQQAILMEASEIGFRLVDRSMCRLIKGGLPVLFEDYWITRCVEDIKEVQLSGILACLSQGNRDPADCFGSDDPEGWFDDPFCGGGVLPPKPPVPPL
jgi:hypothetical protein